MALVFAAVCKISSSFPADHDLYNMQPSQNETCLALSLNRKLKLSNLNLLLTEKRHVELLHLCKAISFQS